MRTSSLYKGLASAGAALVLSVGLTTQASAQVPVFTVDPSVLGGNGTFEASFIQGNSSSLLTLQPDGTTINGAGWVNFTGFENNGTPVAGTGVFNTYTLWAEYTYTTQLVSGTLGAPNSVSDVTALNFTVFGMEGVDATMFTPADASTAQAAVVNPTGTPQEIGSGSLIVGTATFNALGGASFNATATYANTAFGDTFFIDPVPFYDLVFQEFNNTSQGIERSGDLISIVSASGGVDFNTSAVPEPASLALFGMGMLGFGLASYRRRRDH